MDFIGNDADRRLIALLARADAGLDAGVRGADDHEAAHERAPWVRSVREFKVFDIISS
jgi:hypothetical protein